MTSMKKLIIILFLPLLPVFFSCSARIDGEFREGGEVNLAITTSLEPKMVSLIRSLRGFMGENNNEPILDGGSIGQSMAASPGV